MKTKKYSISLKAFTALVFAFAFSAFLNAQTDFVTPAPSSNTQLTPEEVRAASAVTYDLNNINHTSGDSYRWAVRGGTITGGTPSGDSSVTLWVVDLVSIDVTWDNTIVGALGSDPGQIIVQKRIGGSCASQLQVLDITMWNPATANFNLATLITEMCSGEAFTFTVPVDLTGSADPVATNFGFDVLWEYEDLSGDLEDLLGNSVHAITGTAVSNTALAQIPLPGGLINTGTADATFTVRLTSMQDDFDVPGAVGAIFEYNITVHPTPATGDINSTPAGMLRR